MIKTISAILFLTTVTFQASAQATFNKTFGQDGYYVGNVIEQTSDGGFIIAGYGNTGNPMKFYLLKLNSNGDSLWSKYYGNYYSEAHALDVTEDNGFVITGRHGYGEFDIMVIKTDSLGNTLWTKYYGGNENDWGRDIKQTKDGGFVIVGQTSSFGAGLWDIYILKTDSAGDTLWTKTYGDTLSNYGYSVAVTTKGYLVAGYTYDTWGVNSAIDILNLDSVGDTIWTRKFNYSNYEFARSVLQDTDSGFILSGKYLLKIDSMGNKLWDKPYVGEEVCITTDNGYAITGTHITSKFDYTVSMQITKTNSSGDSLWSSRFNRAGYENHGHSIVQTSDGGFIMAGRSTQLNPPGQSQILVVKTDSMGQATYIRSFAVGTDINLNVYPNPTDGQIIIDYSNLKDEITEIQIADIHGSLVYSKSTGLNKSEQYSIDLTGNSKGVYFLTIQTPEKQFNMKIVLID